jgi:hypothetical protein
MSTKGYPGIDYAGFGSDVNRAEVKMKDGDVEIIRYGIIPQNDVLQGWSDSSEPDYGPASCPSCGNEAIAFDKLDVDLSDEEESKGWKISPHECEEWACEGCKRVFGGESAYPDEALGFTYEAEGIKAFSGDDGGVWVVMSPFFTYAQFCSPCAPGACYLRSPLHPTPPHHPKCFCLPADWFEGEGEECECPYPVYKVETGECVYTPKGWGEELIEQEIPRTPDEV